MNKLIVFICLFSLNTNLFGQDHVEFIPMEYGEFKNPHVYLTTTQKAGGKLMYADKTGLIIPTDSIQLKIGLHFGVKFMLKSKDSTGTTILKIKWKIIHLDGKEENEIYDYAENNNKPVGVAMVLQEEEDLIPGTYILELTYATDKTFSQTFYLYP